MTKNNHKEFVSMAYVNILSCQSESNLTHGKQIWIFQVSAVKKYFRLALTLGFFGSLVFKLSLSCQRWEWRFQRGLIVPTTGMDQLCTVRALCREGGQLVSGPADL